MLITKTKESRDLKNRLTRAKKSIDFEYENRMELEKNYELTQKKLQKELQLAKESEDRFISSISHEIRTPLSSIIGFSSLLLDSKISKTEKEYVKNIEYSANILLSLVNDVLDVNRFENQGIELDLGNVNIHNVIYECIETTSPLIEKGVECVANLPKEDLFVLADYVRLKQIFINLLRNAAKLTKSGFIKISIEDVQESADDILVAFSVEDSGFGIDDSDNKLFSPFRDGNKKVFNSTGLGLYITKNLVEIMGGKISYESAKGVGTTFQVTLSFKKSLSNELHVGAFEKNYDGITILLVEDIDINRSMYKKIFENNFNAVVTEACHGQEALEVLKGENFDVVFMDIEMPVLNGLEATKKIREFNKKIPILALTANITDIDKQLSYQVGMNGFIKKPLDLQDLLKIFDRLNIDFVQKKVQKETVFSEAQTKSFKSKAYNRLMEVHKDESIASELFLIAKNSIANYLQNAVAYLEEQNIEKLLKTMHTLKGVFWTYGLKEEGDLISSEEKVLKRERKPSNTLEKNLLDLSEFVSQA